MMEFRDKGFVLATVLMLIWVSSSIVANPGQSTQLSLGADTGEPVVGESIVLEGYLKSSGAGISGGDVDIYIDGVKVYTVQTDGTGYYGVMKVYDTAGTHTFQAKFSGDGAYDSSESPKVDVTWQAAVKASAFTCTQTVKVKNKDTDMDMPHITVEARPDIGTIIKCTTDDYGECELDLTEGETYTVVANWLSFPPDYECHPISDCEESITACKPGLKTFRLKNMAPLPCDQPVIVINKEGGLGIEDVNVVALQYGVTVGDCLTGDDGRCTILGLNRDEMYDIAMGTHSNVYECESIGDCEYNMLRACEDEITLKLRGSLIEDPFNSVWAETFMITPRLEDNKNNWRWTKTGYSNLYDGGGFDRADACELRCDGQRECNLFEGCTLFEGNSGQCSNCEDDHLTPDDKDCTHDSKYDADGDP
ncbi:MAG: Ig-like domain-containing protein, partial [Candidatus Altiarchaeota archaeon]|nr:Ig-like domain-containing protein [Candidatus Altiarchaeota archaeon]